MVVSFPGGAGNLGLEGQLVLLTTISSAPTLFHSLIHLFFNLIHLFFSTYMKVCVCPCQSM